MKKVLKSNSQRDYLLFVTGINIGLRVSDLLQLTWRDVLTEKSKIVDYILVKEQKTGKTRKITLNTAVKKALVETLSLLNDVQPDNFLFPSQKGGHLSRTQTWVILTEAAHTVGIEGSFGTHGLRKTFGYWAYQSGIDITLLMDLFGHSSQSITLRYIGITQENIDQVYLAVNL